MFTWLPHIKEEKPYFKTEKYSFDRVNSNIEIIRKFYIKTDTMKLIDKIYLKYNKYMRCLEQNKTIKDEIIKGLDDLMVLNVEKSGNKYCEFIWENMYKFDRNVLLSDSHATTYYILKTIKEFAQSEQIAVVCFDAHADIYEDEIDIWKGNIFNRLLREEIIESILFVGVPEFRKQSIMNEVKDLDMCKKIFFGDIKDKKIETNIEIKRFLSKNIKSIYYSIDVDVFSNLNNLYTAMEYSYLHPLLNLSYVDLKHMKKDEVYDTVDNCFFVKESHNDGYKNLFQIGRKDIDICDLIDYVGMLDIIFKENNISKGIVYKNRTIIGDIVELNGIDLNGETHKMVRKVIDNALMK
ncbi:MAG TPA: hypothetical protein DCP90_00095 [Clostridiales bacterium]|nr:MAG: hypothetical protein A2Y22_02590 [Clostridiales bacterium GWD2_32_59]HAN08995.1 hypothetical protein [Clostridiales bacterium]